MTNPGFLLVSLNQYYEGGISECRNPSLQKMFGLIGKSDKAGSGVDKILKGWRSAKWRRPYIEERSLPDKVELYLPMESLISEENLRALHEKFGDSVYKLDYNRLSILSSAYLEEYVTNNSLRNQIELHPADITKLLRELVKENFLLPSGFGRGTMYYLSQDIQLSTNVPSSDVPSSDVPSSDVPSSDVPSSKFISPEEEIMVLEYCCQWRNASEIAHQIGRSRQHTQKRIIKKLLAKDMLIMEFPDAPTSPKQRYKRNQT